MGLASSYRGSHACSAWQVRNSGQNPAFTGLCTTGLISNPDIHGTYKDLLCLRHCPQKNLKVLPRIIFER